MNLPDTRMRHVTRRLSITRTVTRQAVQSRAVAARLARTPGVRTARWAGLRPPIEARPDSVTAWEIGVMSDSECLTLARDIATGDVWLPESPDQARYAFGLLLSGLDALPRNYGFMYGRMRDALPRTINGCPLFIRAEFCPADAVPMVQAHLDRILATLYPEGNPTP